MAADLNHLVLENRGFGLIGGNLRRCHHLGVPGLIRLRLLIGSKSRITQNKREKNRIEKFAALHTQLVLLPASPAEEGSCRPFC